MKIPKDLRMADTVLGMDFVDKQILLELHTNCRTSYQSLANKLKLTVNAVKKRIKKLTDQQIILGYVVYLSLAMIDAESAVALVYTDGSVAEDAFLDKIGANPMVYSVSWLSDGSVLVLCEYKGAKGFAELRNFLRLLDGVEYVEMHTAIVEKGVKQELSESALKVLKCLRDDARMSISKIAKTTQLTPKRVRAIIQNLLGESGSVHEAWIQNQSIGDYRTSQASVHFRLKWDLNAGGALCFIAKMKWDETQGDFWPIVRWLQEEFPQEFWFAYTSATEPVLFSIFMVDHMREAEPLVERLVEAPYVSIVKAIFGYPAKKYQSLREIHLEEILKEVKL